MNTETKTPVATTSIQTATPPTGRRRPARALIGWLPQDQACRILAGPAQAAPFSAAIVERAAKAHASVAARPATGNPPNTVLSDPPDVLSAHIAELDAMPFFAPFKAEGWRPAVVDLRHVRALQPVVHSDHAEERTRDGVQGDLLSLARITLPITRSPEIMHCESAPDGRRWTLTCRNPHLRILQPLQPDPTTLAKEETKYDPKPFGFMIELSRSYVKVIRWRGIYMLFDGYHRTHGLLLRGIYEVPVLFAEIPSQNDAPQIPGLFVPAVYLSERPPYLLDYLNDDVSAAVEVQATQRSITIQALETDVPLLS